MKQQLEMSKALEALGFKRGVSMGMDTSKPIRFKTIQKNTKLAEFVVDESVQIKLEEPKSID